MYFPVTDHDFSHLRHVADFLRVETIVAIVKNGFARGRRYPYRALTDLWCKLVHRLAHVGSAFSRVGTSDKPHADHCPKKGRTISILPFCLSSVKLGLVRRTNETRERRKIAARCRDPVHHLDLRQPSLQPDIHRSDEHTSELQSLMRNLVCRL